MLRSIGVLAFAAALGLGSALPRPASPRSPKALVIHEWGTITTAHAANGAQQGRLNRLTTFEPLPEFVHRYEPPVTRDGARVIPLLKLPLGEGNPDVTMRLETPVMYFHPAAEAGPIAPFDVSVDFRGGVLNEFYPDATAGVTGWNAQHLTESTTGSLAWKGVSLDVAHRHAGQTAAYGSRRAR